MSMKDGLARRGTVIDPYVEASRLQFSMQDVPHGPDRYPEPLVVFVGQLVQRGDVPSRNDERMSRRDWMSISEASSGLTNE